MGQNCVSGNKNTTSTTATANITSDDKAAHVQPCSSVYCAGTTSDRIHVDTEILAKPITDLRLSLILSETLLWEMIVGVGGVCSLTSEVLASLNKGVPPLACFDWRGWFRSALPFFRGDMILRLVP
ncbi:hypothetical protein J6590_045277 [Homalodisca vitripennis]|nr:hypothetical protein J6590_045277 [Homalodisca vitripennis]